MKFYFSKHSTVIPAARLACAALSVAALFGAAVPSVPVPNGNGRPPVISGTEIPQKGGTDATGGGQGIAPQNDDKEFEEQKT